MVWAFTGSAEDLYEAFVMLGDVRTQLDLGGFDVGSLT